MLTIDLPTEIETRLETAAKSVGKTKDLCVRDAILDYLEDLEDYLIASQRMHDIQSGKTTPIPHQDVMNEYALDT